MKIALLVLTAAASVLRLPAAVPLSWTVETTRAQPATFEAYQGETLTFEAALQSRGKPLEAPLNYSFFWQTNGMGSTYWEVKVRGEGEQRNNSTVHLDPSPSPTNVLFATWSPEMDVGAKVYNCFIGSPSNIYHAAFQLRLRPSPGALPNALPLPTPVIDFARVRVLNPPWSGGGGGGVDTNAVIDIANATIATNPVVAAKLDATDPVLTPTAPSVDAPSNALASARLTGIALTNRYTRAETDEMLEGKANKNGDSIEDFAAKDINSIGTLTTAEILCGSTIHADGDINCFDSDGNLHHLVSKANRAEYGDADEIATLDADGNPTRSGIAKDKIMPSQGSLYMEEVDPDLQAYEFGIAGYYLFYMGVNFSVLSTGVGDTKWYYGDFHTFDDDREIAVKGDIAAAISATDPIFSNAVLTVTTNTIRREVSAALNTYVDGETGVEYEGKFYGGSLYYVPTGNVYPPNN